MTIEHVPLLSIQRELYARPRDRARFEAYLDAMTAKHGDYDVKLPLVAMNPMAGPAAAARLEELIALDAERVVAETVAGLKDELAEQPGGALRLGLVLVDDRAGGWTHRASADLEHRFGHAALRSRGWLDAWWWTSETPTVEAIRAEIRRVAWRATWNARHGSAETLRARLRQEGTVLWAAGGWTTNLSEDELDYTGAVLAPLMDSPLPNVAIAALFGDAAARSLGLEPLGLDENAGLAWAMRAAAGEAR